MNNLEERLNDLVVQIEYHSVEGIKNHFLDGINPNSMHNGRPLFYTMIEMYTRSPRFKDCVQAFVENGLLFDDRVLLAVLLDDAVSLDHLILDDPMIVYKKYSLECTYTPLREVSLLHICAEYNHLACAKILVDHGADINVTAGVDALGFGGQTPVFHTVNQNQHNSAAMLEYLLQQSADLSVTVKGIVWGQGFEWETLVPSVNPISYAMMGLLPQMHRNEQTISNVVQLLVKHQYGIYYSLYNVPCAYLQH